MEKGSYCTILTPYFPSKNNQYGGIFVYDQVIEMSKYLDKIDVFVTRPIFSVSRKFPFIKIIKNNSIFIDTNVLNITIRELKYLPFPKDTFLYHKSLSFSLLFYKKLFYKNTLIHTVYPLGVAANNVNIKSNIVIHGSDLRYFIKNKQQKRAIVNSIAELENTIVVSNGLKKEVIALGIDPKSITVIENGIKINKMPHYRESSEIFKFVFVGSLIVQKGIYELLDSFIHLLKEYSNIELYFIGDGIEKKRLIAKSSSYINKSIFFLGSISNEKVIKELSLMECLVLPSYQEGFGRVIIEMMSLGKPVISTYSGGPEYIINKSNGILIDSKNTNQLKSAMSRIIEDYSKYESNEIYNYIKENYDLKNQTRKVIDLVMPSGNI
jgi:glycosyltransferase involved in cell wall biosynthesis